MPNTLVSSINKSYSTVYYYTLLTSSHPSSPSQSTASQFLHIPSPPCSSPPSERFPSSLEPLPHSPVSRTPEYSQTAVLDTAISAPFFIPTSFTLIARREDIDIVHPFPSSNRGSELDSHTLSSHLTSTQTTDETRSLHTPSSFQHNTLVPSDRFKTNKPCIE